MFAELLRRFASLFLLFVPALVGGSVVARDPPVGFGFRGTFAETCIVLPLVSQTVLEACLEYEFSCSEMMLFLLGGIVQHLILNAFPGGSTEGEG